MRGRGRGGKGGVSTLPPKPKGFEDAKNALQAQIGERGHVGWGFGFTGPRGIGVAPLAEGEIHAGAWQLYVYSDDEALQVPVEVKGISVTKRPIPRAFGAVVVPSPAGGSRGARRGG